MIGNRDLILDRTKPEYFTFHLNHCGLSACNAGYTYGFQMRPYHLLHVIFKGTGTLWTGNQEYQLHAGQAFYIPAGSRGKYQASPENPWKYGWIGFYADSRSPFLEQVFRRQPVIDLSMPIQEMEQLILAIVAVSDRRFHSYTDAYEESDYPGEQFTALTKFSQSMEANSRLLHLFSRLLETQAADAAFASHRWNPAADAKAYIDACYCEPLKIRDVAASLHVHPNYLSTVFKKAYGQSPSEYLRMIRMEHSAMLLGLTDDPVSAIAHAVGYQNPFQFSSAFKQHFCISPSAYRKQQKR
ncbi:MAG: AraC family transcriptional regulator [Eubacterium sp.]|nr:AraC family transcriptional regulator [Eubacterium sp.]